jgi:ribosome maturation factor RimP
LNKIEEIRALFKPLAEKHNTFLVDISLRGERGSNVLEIFIDNVDGITTEICSKVSRDFSEALDAADFMKGKYFLNVSSPGMLRPLQFLKQYKKHIGRQLAVRIKCDDKIEEFTGELENITDNKIILKLKSGIQQEINFTEILEAKLKTPW